MRSIEVLQSDDVTEESEFGVLKSFGAEVTDIEIGLNPSNSEVLTLHMLTDAEIPRVDMFRTSRRSFRVIDGLDRPQIIIKEV